MNTNRLLYRYFRKSIYRVAENGLVYRVARRLAYDHEGQNNCDINTNGEADFLREHAKNCEVIFDAGANIGEWTRAVLALNPGARAHCFEPNKETFKILLANNFPERVICNNAGLGSERGEKRFYVFGGDSTVNSIYPRAGMTPLREDIVRIDTIDNYCSDKRISKIDFLKIDVEGGELEVLKGASEIIKNGMIDIIQFEYGGTYIDAKIFLKDIFEYFSDFGYHIYKIHPGRVELIARYDSSLDDFQYANYAVIGKDYAEKYL